MRLVYEEELQGRAPQVVAPQMHLSQLRQRPLEVEADSWGHKLITFSKVVSGVQAVWGGKSTASDLKLANLPPSPLSHCCRRRSKYGAW